MRKPLSTRIAAIDWNATAKHLSEDGFATTGTLLDENECAAIAALYDDEPRFRSRVDMAQHNFGMGEYKYFNYPLPKVVQALRTNFYPRLSTIANQWAALL